MRRAPALRLSRDERRRLDAAARSPATSRRLAMRARIILRAADGRQNRQIASALGTDAGTVALWRRRFLMQRLPGIERDAPRPGRPPVIPTSTIQVIVRTTLGRLPPNASRWTARALAKAVGVSKTTVQRVWRSHHIEPRRATTAPRPGPGMAFADKVTDLVGLYLYPPERAMAFSVDERAKSSALGRSERNAIDQVEERGRAVEFRAFLQAIDRETPKELDLHLLLDNRQAPTSPEVRRWLVRHPRFVLHFLPSDGSAPNLIERWFGEFTRKRATTRSFPSVLRLHRAVRDHFSALGASLQPFTWTATREEIRDRSERARIP